MTLVARNYAYGGVWRSLVFGGSSESGVRRSVLCRCVWQECGFCHREDVFTFKCVTNSLVLYVL
jgi:hypothetical protein